MGRFLAPTAVVCLAALPCCAAVDVVINEVFYDPDGSDTGLEFIEVMNCGHAAVPLAGWTLETGNGAHPGDWTVEWIGGPLDELEPGGILLVGERDVVPEPDDVTALDLQNGPDGCRLSDGESVVDVVGWGEPLFAEYSEGQPAADVASGLSLSRMPDCLDTDENAVDFTARLPTPGARNTVARDLSVSVRHARRVVHPSGEPVKVTAVVRNLGAESFAAGEAVLRLTCNGREVDVLASSEPLSPRDSCAVDLEWMDPVAGYHGARVSAHVEGDGVPSNNEARTTLAVDHPGRLLVVNEIMYSPGDSATEWIELVATAAETVDVVGWLVGDEEDGHAVLSEEGRGGGGDRSAGVPVAPGGFLLVARDPELVETSGAAVVTTDGWEALSRDDVIVLLDGFGTPIDRVAYDGDWGGGRDVSLERVRPDLDGDDPAGWGSCVAPGGSTPGLANSILIDHLPFEGALTASPNPFSPDGDGRDDRTVVTCDLPTATALARLSIYDIRGRLRGRLLDHQQVASRHELVWDGSSDDGALPAGLYILFLEAIDARAGVLTRAKTVVGIAR